MQKIESNPASLETEDHGEFQLEVLADIFPAEWVAEALAASGSQSRRQRKLPATFMVYFVILLGLYRRVSYANLLEKLHGTRWTTGAWREGAAPTTRAVTAARDRLGAEVMSHLFLKSAVYWELQSEGRSVAGLRCYALDGVCMKVPDSEENREHYGAPGASRGESAFPQMRAALLVDVATHLVRAERHGPYRVGEVTLAHQLLRDIFPGMLVIADRNFYKYAFICGVLNREAAILVRAKRKGMKVRAYEHLGDGDDLVWVWRSESARRKDPTLPPRLKMRRITYRPDGGRENIVLLTTLTDPIAASAEDLALAYQSRWEAEAAFDEVKTHLCGGATVNHPVIFRSMIPSRVEQEYYGLLIAFNVVCRIKIAAMTNVKVTPAKISFVATLERIREALQEMLWLPPAMLEIRRDKMLRAICRGRFLPRPGRSHPRAVRVKMSKYPLKRRGNAA